MPEITIVIFSAPLSQGKTNALNCIAIILNSFNCWFLSYFGLSVPTVAPQPEEHHVNSMMPVAKGNAPQKLVVIYEKIDVVFRPKDCGTGDTKHARDTFSSALNVTSGWRRKIASIFHRKEFDLQCLCITGAGIK